MTPEIHTLNNVTVSKDELLRILKENLEAHNEVYNASTQAYFESLRVEFEQKVAKAKDLLKLLKGKLENITQDNIFAGIYELSSSLSQGKTRKPESHEADYTSAIRKVELSIHSEFTLTNQDFERYILNNWEWKEDFINTASSYTGGSLQVSGAIMTGLRKFNK